MPDSPAPARPRAEVLRVALAPWAVSALAVLAAWVAGDAADGGTGPSDNVGVALSQGFWVLIAQALAAGAVWCLGAGVVAGLACREGRRGAAWVLLVATAGATMLIGVTATASGIGGPLVLWVLQQVVLMVVAVSLHRSSWGATATG